jgi:xylulokinase
MAHLGLSGGGLSAQAPAGNGGLLGLHCRQHEITPIIAKTGEWNECADGAFIRSAKLSDAQVVRAVVEGRFLSMRARAGAIGLDVGKSRAPRGLAAPRVLATGGGTQSVAMLQIAADIFNSDILRADQPDAAAVGAARRAAHALALSKNHGGDPTKLPYAEFLREAGAGAGMGLTVVARPRPKATAVYDDALVRRWKHLEDRVAAGDV